MSCRLLGVSRSGYYEWAANVPSARAREDAELIERIVEIHGENRGVYGSPRIHAELRDGARHPRRPQTRRAADAPGRDLRDGRAASAAAPRSACPGVRVADDLVERQFRPDGPEPALGRRHHLPAHLGGLALPRRRPGRLQPRGSSAGAWPITCAKSSSSTRCRWPSPAAAPRPGSFTTATRDRQYVSLAFGQAARDAGIARSMGSKGDCYDNAVAESFFATLKKELVHRRSWPTRHELTSEVFEYIEAFYNRVRRHSTLGMLAPLEFENRTLSDHRTQLRRFAAQGLTNSDHQQLDPESPTLSGEPGELQSRSPARRSCLALHRPWLRACRVPGTADDPAGSARTLDLVDRVPLRRAVLRLVQAEGARSLGASSKHPVSSASITIGGLAAGGVAMWAVSHFELVAKGKDASGL